MVQSVHRECIPSQKNRPYDLPAWSADGAKIAFYSLRDGNGEIYTMNADGSNPTRLTNNPAGDYQPTWSPDSTKIAFTSDRDGNANIFTMNADGSNQTRLTKNSANDADPAWSPDGKQIAFETSRDGNLQIYKMKPKPEGKRNRPVNLSKSPAFDFDPAWSGDGKQILFATDRGVSADSEIYSMNTDGTAATQLTEDQVTEQLPTGSPDSTRIAFTSDGDSGWDIFTINADGLNKTNLTNDSASDFAPDWQRTTS